MPAKKGPEQSWTAMDLADPRPSSRAEAARIAAATSPVTGPTTTWPAAGELSVDWGYAAGASPQLAALYAKAKTTAWDPADLDWTTPTPRDGAVFVDDDLRMLASTSRSSPARNWNDDDWARFGHEVLGYTLSQFLHGEQLGLVAVSRLVTAAPDLDSRLCAASQVADEARHLEAFTRYVTTRYADSRYDISPGLHDLFDDVLTDSRWDITYLGVQVLVEGLALAAFSHVARRTTDPLLAELLRLTIIDEARHVSFGILTLRDTYNDMTSAEIEDRQDFACDALVSLRDRLVPTDVFRRLELPVEPLVRASLISPAQQALRGELFARVIPVFAQLGLLDAGNAKLRTQLARLGICRPVAP